MMDERKYEDINGKKVTLYQMVRREPEWAANRIRVCEKLEAEISAQYELAGEKQAEIDRLQRKLTDSNRECMRQSGEKFNAQVNYNEVLNMIEIALGADLTLEEYETVFNKVLDKHRPPKPTINRIDCKGVGDNDGYFEITIGNDNE